MNVVLYEKPVKIELADNELLVDGKKHPKSVRTARQMAKTLMTQYPNELEDFDVYYMYRDIYKKNDIRFDITVIPFRPLGEEYPKTYGHYHPKSEDGLAYPEVYQVLNGSGLFLLQKKNRNGSVDVTMVDAKAKDVVLLPPPYGHNTINSGKELLVLSNLVYDRLTPMYHDYERNRGGAYYYVKGGAIAQNTNYVVEKNERLPAAELNERYKFQCADLLAEFAGSPEKFEFLKKPSLLFKK